MRRLMFLFLLAAPAWGQSEFHLSPEALAFCLDQSDAMDGLDDAVKSHEQNKEDIQRALIETRLRMNTLRDTARVDVRAATRLRALQVERERMLKAFEEADLTITEMLRKRAETSRVFESHCEGRHYTVDILHEAEAIRAR